MFYHIGCGFDNGVSPLGTSNTKDAFGGSHYKNKPATTDLIT